jgi:hypothetical protein
MEDQTKERKQSIYLVIEKAADGTLYIVEQFTLSGTKEAAESALEHWRHHHPTREYKLLKCQELEA